MSDDQQRSEDEPRAVAGAIEYPDRRVQLSQPGPVRNLQDVLRYSTQVSAATGSTQTSSISLDEESRKFLNEALTSMTTDVKALLYESIKTIETLLKSSHFLEEDCDAAFDNVMDFVDNIDFANDFYKIGGFKIFHPCLSSPSDLMRWRCCELIAELCQNNPFCQAKCLEEAFLPKLLDLVCHDSSSTVQIKALYAVSCIVRGNEEAMLELTKSDGLFTLLHALQSDCAKLKIKTSFLLFSMCSLTPKIKNELVRLGFVEQLVGLIIANKSDFKVVEHLLSALLSLVTENPAAEDICRKSDLQLKSILEFIVDNASGLDEAKEVEEYAKKIENTVFENVNDLCEGDR